MLRKDEEGENIVMQLAAGVPWGYRWFEWCEKRGANINKDTYNWPSLLHIACGYGWGKNVKKLIDMGIDVNVAYGEWKPMDYAFEGCDLKKRAAFYRGYKLSAETVNMNEIDGAGCADKDIGYYIDVIKYLGEKGGVCGHLNSIEAAKSTGNDEMIIMANKYYITEE